MTILRHPRSVAPLVVYALLLLAPGAAIRQGLLPFEFRFEALILVSVACFILCSMAGCSRADLGLGAPPPLRRWLGCGVATAGLAAAIFLEARIVGASSAPPEWARFAPFYLLVSAPCQEILCRAVPKLMAERLSMSTLGYVLFSSAIFSLMHSGYGEPLLLVNAFVAGLAWATAYVFTRNVWPLVASHGAVGLFAFWLGAA